MEPTTQKMQSEYLSRTMTTDLATEFILPDYQPEIKRLLRVRAVPLAVDQYLGGSAAEFSGAVEFQALYAAEDASLWCVTKREDYRLSCPFDANGEFDLSEGLVCDVKTDVEGISGRVLAPRKLTARCRVCTAVKLFADKPLAELPEDVERLEGTMTTSRVRIGKSEPFTLTDEIPLDPNAPPVRVISASGEVFPAEVLAGADLVSCRGDILLSLLTVPEQITPSLDDAGDCLPAALPVTEVRRKVPFAVEIPMDGVTPACAANAWGNCTELAVTVEENRILCDVTAVICARAVCREEIPFTRDAYSTAALTEPVYGTLSAVRPLACKNGNCSLSTTKDLAELGIKPDARVIDSTAEITTESPELARGNYVLPGVLHFHVLLQNADGDCSTADFDLPFRFEAPADGDTLPTANNSVLLPVSVKATVDGSRLQAAAELAVALALSATEPVRTLTALRSGDPVPAPAADLTVCYPAPDDTLWSVAARYHTPVSTLLQKNDPLITVSALAADAPGSLSGIRFLVV